MKAIIIISLFCTAVVACRQEVGEKKMTFTELVTPLYDSTLKPFHHGVASGDPLADRVIIWTRVTPEFESDSIPVVWQFSEFKDFSTGVLTDTAYAFNVRDYTIKVDVKNL